MTAASQPQPGRPTDLLSLAATFIIPPMLDPRKLMQEIAAAAAARHGDGSAFQGTWRITSMQTWRPDMIDMGGPGHFLFRDDVGQVRFCAVQADLDCRFSLREDKPLVEFSFGGRDDARPANGRGWAVLAAPGKLEGAIFIHRGDDSTFIAERTDIPLGAPISRRPTRANVLRRLEHEDELSAAQDTLRTELQRRATRTGPLPLGWQGGGGTFEVLWFEKQDLWALLDGVESRWWNCFGLGNPFDDPSARSLVVEINPPKRGTDRRCAGAFLTGEDGLHLAHSGRVGGGRKGVGARAFLQFYNGPMVEVAMTCTRRERLIHVAPLAAPALVDRIAMFVRAVDVFKRQATGSETS